MSYYCKVMTLKGYSEVEDSYKIEEVCDALSNHIRVEILKVLRENPVITIGDLLRELEKRGFKMSHASIRMHIPKLVFSGLVGKIKIDGKDGVVLKKDIRIYVKEVEESEK